MSILFNPPLDNLTSIHLPFHPVDLYFSAKFSSAEDHLNARLSGVRVEIWSDVPGNGTIDGQWRALQFEWLEDSLLLIIPSLALNHPWKTRFSFTYRFVYPDGNIKWLREYGMNGELVIYKNDERLQWASGWRVDQSACVFSSTDNVQAGQLSDKADWALWIWGSKSAPRLLSLADGLLSAKSALLFPRQSDSAIVPFAPILLTSQDTTFSISRSGSITLDSGTLTLQTPSVAELKGLIAAIAGSEYVECDSPYHATIYSKSTKVNPTTLSIISFLSSSPPEFNIPLSKLHREASEVAIYSPSTLQVFFVSSDDCPVTLGFAGSQWLLSPVYEFDSTARVAVLSLHERVTVSVHAHRLPTPPPSPTISTTSIQPLHIPEAEVKSPGMKEQMKSYSYAACLGLIPKLSLSLRRLISLYTGFWWWIFRFIFRRVSAVTNKIFAIINVGSNGGTKTSARRNHLDCVTSGSVTSMTSDGFGHSVTSSNAEEVRLSDFEAHQSPQQHNDENRPVPLTFDVASGKNRIRLAVCGSEDKVKELRFTVDGQESKPSFAGLDRSVWMVELSETSGRLSIYS